MSHTVKSLDQYVMSHTVKSLDQYVMSHTVKPAHLAYLVHKSGRKPSIIIITYSKIFLPICHVTYSKIS
ncbi:hypothetical protein LSH36_246g03025 [Paralvinella palmiformis]|uniref:Uncharacterized protein n=1 Tax=Paralvinella palmiformis TaxID=53620 RepID=A0AAD9JLC7_9ANNE|nr:hypothetical protein LSH36_246g03025 [Paralvinella palmiformis]